MTYDNRLVPVLREGILIIKMILFKMLKDAIAARHPDREQAFLNKLTGAVTNKLFDTPNLEEPFRSFAKINEALIDEELNHIAVEFPEMKIPLTDALRVQFLCDCQEGFENVPLLTRSKDLGILVVEREIPLPDHFMTSARKLGEEYNMTRRVNIQLS